MSSHERPVTHGDTTQCAACGRSWDTHDPEPPPCERTRDARAEALEQIDQMFKGKP